MRFIHNADALAEWAALVSVIFPAHITSISSDINRFSAEITGDMKPSIRALSDGISTATLLHVKIGWKIIELRPFHFTKINPAFVTRQRTGKYSRGTARHSGVVSCMLTDTSVHISSPGRKEAWEWNAATHHEPAAWMYGKKGDPKHSSASLNAHQCCFLLRKALWAAADMRCILRVLRKNWESKEERLYRSKCGTIRGK